MLGELRKVPWPAALALFLAGAVVTAIALMLVVGDGSGSAAAGRDQQLRRLDARDGTVGRRSARLPRPESTTPVSLRRMVGQRFMVGLSGAEPTSALLADARRGEIGGVLLLPEGASPSAVSSAVAKLQRAASQGRNRPLLIAVDQEGGQVKRFPGGPPTAPLSTLSQDRALREGEATGIFLRHYGIDVDLAPVVDLGLPGSFITAQGRTISADPGRVTRIAALFASGLQTHVMPVPKHFPGLGGAAANTDLERSVVEAGVHNSLKPYVALIRGDVPAIMVSTAIYEKLDPSHGAAWSRKIVAGLLRHRLGFRGLVISDSLSSPGVADSLPIPEAVSESAQAGVDMLMISDPESFRPSYGAVLRAARDGRISMGNLTSSYRRIVEAKERFAE